VVAIFGFLGVPIDWPEDLKVVDFMIATEGELKKVNWSTRREIVGSDVGCHRR
jgi:hypothetical protein